MTEKLLTGTLSLNTNKQTKLFSSTFGLKQGDPSSRLLFMLFVNDIVDNINTDLSNIFSSNELKLFLILYADDQVLFATSPETLQSLLNDRTLLQCLGFKHQHR